MALHDSPDGAHTGYTWQRPLRAQHLVNRLRPIEAQGTGGLQALSTRQDHQLGSGIGAIVYPRWSLGTIAPVHLLQGLPRSSSQPPLHGRQRHTEPVRDPALRMALPHCLYDVAPALLKRFFSSWHLLLYQEGTLYLTDMC